MGKGKLNKGKTTTIDLVSPTSGTYGEASRKIRGLPLYILIAYGFPCTWQHLPEQRNHWSLLIFCHFGESLQSETRTPCMLLLDSLEMANPKRLEPNIRKFVADIYKAEGRSENKQLISRIPLLVPKVPQQRNGEECGNFVLYFINLFMEGAPENFSVSEGYPYFMKQNWFTPQGLECFSEKLESLKK